MNTNECSFEGCTKKVRATRLCSGHYEQKRKGKELAPLGTNSGGRPAYDWSVGHKVCPSCKTDKPRDDYYTSKGKPTSKCKVCMDVANFEWREANKDKVKTCQRNWREANEGHTYETKTYIKHIGYAHPIANASGITPVHRIILWDKIGPGEHKCHWNCGRTVSWEADFKTQWQETLVVDHVNGVMTDNRPENLVPSCNLCNIHRNRKPRPECSFEGCENVSITIGLCGGHYSQQYSGRPLAPLTTDLTEAEMDEVVQRVKMGQTVVSIGTTMDRNPTTIARAFKRRTGVSVRAFRAGASL